MAFSTISRRSFASCVTIVVFIAGSLAAATLGISSASGGDGFTHEEPTLTTPLANPPLAGACGINVALEFDTSGSIDNTELAQMKHAAKDFVDALTLTPSSVALYHFDIDASVVSGFTSVGTPSGGTTVKNTIDGIDGGSLTNWDAAFKILDPNSNAVSKADLVIIMTDGNPTTNGYPVHVGSPDAFDNLNEGIKSANGVKADGTRIVGVGIGDDLNVANLRLISGSTLGDDYYTTSFGDLGSTLGDIARKVCHSTVAVTKLVNGSKQSDWVFSANGSPSKTVDDGVTTFEWDAAEPAVRSITETSRDGFTFAAASCSDRAGPVAVSSIANGISLTLGPTDHVSCTFTNDPHPQIAVDKIGPDSAVIGTVATYTITVANPGAMPLHDVAVSDPTCSVPQRIGGDANGNGLLDPGEVWTYSCHHTVVLLDGPTFENTATASGSAYGSTVSDRGSHALTVLEPAIAVVKDGPATAHLGDTVIYTIAVSNPGEAVLFDIQVSDPICSTPAFVGGDANANAALDLTEIWTYTCTHDITAGDGSPLVNTATVSGSVFPAPPVDGPDERVTASVEHSVGIVLQPAIAVVKDGPAVAHVGDTVIYTIAVSNPGDSALFAIQISDPTCSAPALAGGDANANAALDLTETWTYTCIHEITASDADPFVNTATASGSVLPAPPVDGSDQRVTASAEHAVNIIHPEIVLTEKADPISGTPGTPVNYTYVVTNTGDTPLADVTITDDKLGAVASGFSLDPGESATYTKSTTMQAEGSIINVGTASGTDGLQKVVTASAVATISVVLGNQIERPLPTTGAAGTDPLTRAGAGFLCIGVALTFGAVREQRRRASA